MIRKPIPLSVRAVVMRRAFGRCEECGHDGLLEFHHLNYTYEKYHGQIIKEGDGSSIFGHETANDLVLLCRECHYARHVVGGEFYRNPSEADGRRIQYERDMAL